MHDINKEITVMHYITNVWILTQCRDFEQKKVVVFKPNSHKILDKNNAVFLCVTARAHQCKTKKDRKKIKNKNKDVGLLPLWTQMPDMNKIDKEVRRLEVDCDRLEAK